MPQKACYNDAHAGIKEADIKLQKAYEDFRKDVHMKKHAIGQTLANFKNWWRLLEQVRKDGNGIIDDNATIGRIHKVSVKDIFENLDTTISKLSTQLNKFDTGYGLLKEDIALTEFIENYILGNRSPLFRYEYNSVDHRSIEDIPEVDFDENQNGEVGQIYIRTFVIHLSLLRGSFLLVLYNVMVLIALEGGLLCLPFLQKTKFYNIL